MILSLARGLLDTVWYRGRETFTYRYDSRARPSQITNPNGTTVSTAYDPMGRVTQLYNDSPRMPGTPFVARFDYSYNPNGQVQRKTESTRGPRRTGGLQERHGYTEYQYDPIGQLGAVLDGYELYAPLLSDIEGILQLRSQPKSDSYLCRGPRRCGV